LKPLLADYFYFSGYARSDDFSLHGGKLFASDRTANKVTAKTLESKLDSFERLDRMLASLEARRNNALREIDRHRAAFGGGGRRSIEEIEDADFRDVETGQATGTGP
jgi:hypothetical protein